MIDISQRVQDDFQAFMKLFARFSAMLHVAAPGIIQSFDATAQTVTVQLAIKERVTLDGDANNSRTTDDQEFPVLSDLPIVSLRGGGFSVTVPIQAGDECLVVFADSCFDAWFQSGGIQSQMFKRRHSLADGFAIVGVGSKPNAIASYATDKMQIRNIDGTVSVDIKSAEIDVTAPTIKITGSTNVFINNKDFLLHTHSGVTSGIGDTGPVA